MYFVAEVEPVLRYSSSPAPVDEFHLSSAAPNVFLPTMPSCVRPQAFCSCLVAYLVFEPNLPSMSAWSYLVPLLSLTPSAYRMICHRQVALEVLCVRAAGVRNAQVLLPPRQSVRSDHMCEASL